MNRTFAHESEWRLSRRDGVARIQVLHTVDVNVWIQMTNIDEIPFQLIEKFRSENK